MFYSGKKRFTVVEELMQYWHVLESTENHDNEGKKRSRPAEKLNRGTQQLKGNFRFIFIHLFHYRICYKSLTNEKPGELSRENMMSFHVKITYPHTLNDHRCYGYTINHDHIFKRPPTNGCEGDWYFIGVCKVNRTLHGRLTIRNFFSCIQK